MLAPDQEREPDQQPGMTQQGREQHPGPDPGRIDAERDREQSQGDRRQQQGEIEQQGSSQITSNRRHPIARAAQVLSEKR
jgi:hypothetical protein